MRGTPGGSRWPYLSLIPIGLGAWAPVYAGLKARRPSWTALGVLWTLIVVAGFTVNAGSHRPGHDDLAGFLLIAGWVGAVATSFTIRGSYDRLMQSPLHSAVEAGEERLAARAKALEIARERPALAREIGLGRPDERGGFDAGLVDVNNAPASALATLPGVDDALATRIVELRARTNGFSSLEDFGSLLDLPADCVERLRDRAVFLPR
jgi:Helix-hairpin-helix motif